LKSLTCFAILLVLLIPSLNFAQVSASKKSDLVGSWHFEEGTGLIAHDSSPNGNNGFLCAGRFENSLGFDGINDYVEVPDSAALRLQEFSLEVWVWLDDVPHGTLTILEKAIDSTASSYSLKINADNRVVFTVQNKAEGKIASWQTTISDFSPFPVVSWYHVDVTYRNQYGDYRDGRIFISDYEVAQSSILFTSVAYGPDFSIEYSSGPLFIGMCCGQSEAFDGLIDEVRISNVDRNTVGPEYFFSRYIQAPLDMYTAGLWHFDEGTGLIVHDETTNDNDGTLHGAYWLSGPTWVDGPFGKALQFDGVDDHIVVPDSPSLHITGGLTIELWVFAHSVLGIPVVVNKQYGESYFLQLTGDWIEFGGFYPIAWLSTNPTPVFYTGSWVHLAGTFDEATDTIVIYVNGVAVKTSTEITGWVGISDRPLVIAGSAGGNEWHFNGILDEIQIWNRALSAKEIRHHASFPVKGHSVKVDWHVTADIMPAPPYGFYDIPGSDTASSLTVTQLFGSTAVVLEGKMEGLYPLTSYQVMIANAYQPKGSSGEGWPGQLVESVIYFMTDKHGEATWKWELANSDFPSWLARPYTHSVSVWINLPPEEGQWSVLGSDNFAVTLS
jgi:hypothetical protein